MKIRELSIDGFERVVFGESAESGLRAFVVVHNTELGAALGGLRMWSYPSEEEALTDACRLAEGMTYKNAAAGFNLGGGKAVVLRNPSELKTSQVLRDFGHLVNHLGGSYVTAEDVGTCLDDLVVVRQVTPHVVGLPLSMGSSGDPAPWTALGVECALRACAQECFGTEELSRFHFVVQGAGAVGSALISSLASRDARCTISDVVPERLSQFCHLSTVKQVSPEAVYDVDCDFFVPCALGGSLNDETIPRLRCRAIAGSANNQLAHQRHAASLQARGILYAPDFIVSSGGVANVSVELMPKGYDPTLAKERVTSIGPRLQGVFREAKALGVTPTEAAQALALARFGSDSKRGRDRTPCDSFGRFDRMESEFRSNVPVV